MEYLDVRLKTVWIKDCQDVECLDVGVSECDSGLKSGCGVSGCRSL